MLCCREATALQQHLLSHHVGNIAVCLTVCSHHYNNFDKKKIGSTGCISLSSPSTAVLVPWSVMKRRYTVH